MRTKFTVAAFLVIGLLSSRVLLGATQGGVKGRVVVNLQGIEGIPLTLVNVATGQSFSVRTAKDGSYSISLPNGAYVVSSSGVRGLSIGRAPLLIQVSAGKFASADIEMARALAQNAAGGGTSIFHNPIGCVAKNEFPVFDTTFQPAGSVVSAKLYFKSNLSDEWFYTEFQALSGNFPKYMWTMTADAANPGKTTQGDDIRRRWVDGSEPESIDPGVPPTHRAFLPKIKEGSGITEVTYYIQVTLADFTETRTREIPVRILGKGEACKGGFAAPAGAPTQGLAVLTSGGLAGAPAGFASIGLSLATDVVGTALSLGTVAVADTVVLTDSSPTPTPTPAPTPTPTPAPTPTPTPAPPTPTPTPTPAPGPPSPTPTPTPIPPTPTPTPSPSPTTCFITVSVNPPGGTFNPCQASVHIGTLNTIVTSTQTFSTSCSSTVNVTSILGPPASFTGPPQVTWSGACSGDAVTTPCILSPTLPAVGSVVLECGCGVAPVLGVSSCTSSIRSRD